jgi:hypothetical protein
MRMATDLQKFRGNAGRWILRGRASGLRLAAGFLISVTRVVVFAQLDAKQAIVRWNEAPADGFG